MSAVVRLSLTSDWTSPRDLAELFNRMTTDGCYEWVSVAGTRYRLVVDDPEPDHWIVINRPNAELEPLIDPARTIVLQMEPNMDAPGLAWRWEQWASPDPGAFLQVRGRGHRNACDWWVGLTWRELVEGPLPPKTLPLGACVSAKYEDPGHRLRVDLLRALDADPAVDLAVWGSDLGLRSARGATPLHDKRSAILPCAHWIDAENNALPGFYTEKLVDALLAECLCFYWGCPDLDAYFDPDVVVRLDMADRERSIATIKAVVVSDERERRLPAIRHAKQQILHDYAFFPTVARVLDAHRSAPAPDAALAAMVGDRRGGRFVEVGDGTTSDTLALEQARQWHGVCLLSDAGAVGRWRAERDSIVVADPGGPLAPLVARHGIDPSRIDWIALRGPAPQAELERLDGVSAAVVTFREASPEARAAVGVALAHAGYEPTGEPWAVRRRPDDLTGRTAPSE